MAEDLLPNQGIHQQAPGPKRIPFLELEARSSLVAIDIITAEGKSILPRTTFESSTQQRNDDTEKYALDKRDRTRLR